MLEAFVVTDGLEEEPEVHPLNLARASKCGVTHLNLPRLNNTGALTKCSQEQIQPLFEGVVAMLSSKEQELVRPAYQVGLMFGQGQLPYPQEVGITFWYDLQIRLSTISITPVFSGWVSRRGDSSQVIFSHSALTTVGLCYKRENKGY